MAVSAEARRHALGVLAKADMAALDECWQSLGLTPHFRHLRPPETGLVMLRGRVGGAGAPFNFGEMTMTRCSVVLEDRTVGHGYVGGSNPRHAELAALCDALLQTEAHSAAVERRVIHPLEEAAEQKRRATASRVAATRVDFFTVARETGA
jgi:alpha-D-ribose 1-methylphosphonate 5-triphosphate synthase subunit PhnG